MAPPLPRGGLGRVLFEHGVTKMRNYLSLQIKTWQKLSPMQLIHSPVMLVVFICTLITAGLTLHLALNQLPYFFQGACALILLFTVWFANFAEALAEAHGKGQAASLRSARRDLRAWRLIATGEEDVPASALRRGDRVRVIEGAYIPADGEITQGVATINESAVTGESAPVLREADSDHCGVIGGTKVLSGNVMVTVTADPGQSFLDRMIGLVESATRQKTPNEIALNILLVAMTIVFIIVVVTLIPMAKFMGIDLDITMLIALLVCLIPTTISGLLPAIGIAGMNRALAANVMAKSGKAVELAGDIDTLLLDKTGTITYGDRQATAFLPVHGISIQQLIEAAVLASLQDNTPEGKSVLKLAQIQHGVQQPTFPSDATWIPFSAETRLSGLHFADGQRYIKGASSAVQSWAQQQHLPLPNNLEALLHQVAKPGGTPLVVANHQAILGVIELSDVIKPGVTERFARLRALGVRTIMITGDNRVTAGTIAAEAGVDDFIAEAKPEDKLAFIRQQQAEGRLVAMVGDGTNDAPALAQADVGMAMNSGTEAAREAGNMVDLDSDPTKLLSMIEIGKQLLITRGALTTFSLANDVAKYFAIVPAVFASALPGIAALDILQLNSPQSAVLSALIFNAAIIPALIPLALTGVKVKPMSAEKLLRNNMLIYGLGGVIAPFIGIKGIDLLLTIILS